METTTNNDYCESESLSGREDVAEWQSFVVCSKGIYCI